MTSILWILLIGNFFPVFCYIFCGVAKKQYLFAISTVSSLSTFVGLLIQLLNTNQLPTLEILHFSNVISISIHLDQFSRVFILLCSFLSIPSLIYCIEYMHKIEAKQLNIFMGLIHISLGITMLIAISANLVTLFIFYELLTITTYSLVNYENSPASKKASAIYLYYLMIPSLVLFLPSIGITYIATGSIAFDETLLVNLEGWHRLGLFLMFVYGISKTALFPLHGWLPRAMIAPTPVSALLHAVAVVKSGIFCLLKVTFYIFGTHNPDNHTLGIILTCIASITIIFASIMALREKTIKGILAYSTISQLSYIVISISMFTYTSMSLALQYTVVHAFAKITLFFTAGSLYICSGVKNKTDVYGIGRRMPATLLIFTIGALTMIGIPPTGAFLYKAQILQEAFHLENYILIFTLIISTAFNCLYFLPLIMNSLMKNEDLHALNHTQRIYIKTPTALFLPYLMTATFCIVIFVYSIYKY